VDRILAMSLDNIAAFQRGESINQIA
jgi:hypothetical protein